MRTDDGSIIYECLNGEPEAFGVLVDKYKEGIYAFVYHKLGDFQDAQDVTQEVFLQAYRGLRGLRRWESFGFWLYRIAYARCSQWLRIRSKRVDREFIEDQNSSIMDSGSLDSYRDGQLNQSLREALDSLTETHREVLTLYYFGGMKNKEIARAIGASPGAIRARLSRARARLREEMVDMMDTAFEGQKIPAGFTLRIVEAVRHIKINPMPRVAGLPWGLSLAAGIIIAALALNPHLSIPSNTAYPASSPLPIKARVLKTGEIPVDILKTSNVSIISSKQGDGDGKELQFQVSHNAPMLAPQVEDGTWTKREDMLTASCGLSTSVINGKIYVIGGYDSVNQLSTLEEYDPSTGKWTKKANMPTVRANLSTAVVNGKIYVIGGAQGWFSSLTIVEEYDPVTDEWTRKADMPTARSGLSTSVVSGKIYAIGGFLQSQDQSPTVEKYDPATDTWTEKANMPMARGDHSASVVNGKIYVIGGLRPFMPATSPRVEEYDPVTDTWTRKTNMPTPRYWLSTSVVNGKIYAIGGSGVWLGNGLSIVEEYDPVTDTWTKKGHMPTPRFWLSSSMVDGKIYAIGGTEAWLGDTLVKKPLSTVEVYTPEDWQPVSPQGKLQSTWGEIKLF